MKTENRARIKKIHLIITILILSMNTPRVAQSTPPTVGPNINVTDDPFNQNEPMVAINPNDHNNLVVGYNDYRTGGPRVGWSWSEDGGSTWSYGGNLLPTGFTSSGDPVVAFYFWGTAYYAGLCWNYVIDDPDTGAGHSEDGSIFFASSFDGGHTFSTPLIVTTGSGTDEYLDKPWLFVNKVNGHIYLAWTKYTSNFEYGTIWFTRSTDGGNTWEDPIQVSHRDLSIHPRSHGAQIAVGPGDVIFVSWVTWPGWYHPGLVTLDDDQDGIVDGGWEPPKIYISSSYYDELDQLSFLPPRHVATKTYSYPAIFPSLAADPSTGKVYIAYVDRPTYPGDLDVYVAQTTWTTTGMTAQFEDWTSTRVNDDPLDNGIDQYWPSLDIAPHGRVDVIWYDKRDQDYGVYYTASNDGGDTWEANLKITDLDTGFTWPEYFAGDYITVASMDDKVQVAWMDYRHGGWDLEIYTGAMKYQTPVASFTTSVLNAAVDTSINFDASDSYDPDGTIASYEWDFDGDGSYDSTGVTTSHAYPSSGTYTITLRVSDNEGLSETTTKIMNIRASTTWYYGTVDSGTDPSIAVDSTGKPHIAYYTGGYAGGVTGFPPGVLKYATWVGPSYDDWVIEIVDDSSTHVGVQPVISLDSNDNPHIVYGGGFLQSNLKNATRDPDTGEWVIDLFAQGNPMWCLPFSDPSIAMDSNDMLHASYVSWEGSSYAPYELENSLYYKGPSTLPAQIIVGDGASQPLNPSLTLDRDNNPHITYFQFGTDQLVLMYAVGEGNYWKIRPILRASASSIDIRPTQGTGARMVAYISESGLKIAMGDWPWVSMTGWSPGLFPEPFVIDSEAARELNLDYDSGIGPRIAYITDANELRFVGWTPERRWSVETVDPGPVGYVSMDIISTGVGYAVYEEVHLAYSAYGESNIYYATTVAPDLLYIDVMVSDPSGVFSVAIDAGIDKGAPITSWTIISTTNIVVLPNIVLTNSDMTLNIEGQLIDPSIEGQIVLEVDPNGEIITYDITINPYEPTIAPGIVLLVDTSGSMSWSYDGDRYEVEESEKKITLVKNAVIPFLQMLREYSETDLGLVIFPWQPWEPGIECMGKEISSLTLADDAVINTYLSDFIPNIEAHGNTPLLAGVEKAMNMFEDQPKQTIILLSDGYHNCPYTVDPYDSEVNNLLNQLDDRPLRVYTIGFAKPTDYDEPLLTRLATETQGDFHDVTELGFSLESWDPATDLQNVYESILVDWLELESISDPFGVINSGQKETYEVKINEHDQKISFYLSWAQPDIEGLYLRIKTSDDQQIPETGNGISIQNGETHVLITVDKAFLQLPGKIGQDPWTIEIDASDLVADQIKYQYSIIADSNLKMRPSLQSSSFETGTSIELTVEITEDGASLTGLTNVEVNIIQPEDGLGNWYANNDVSLDVLEKFMWDYISNETLSMRQVKAMYLIDELQINAPGKVEAGSLRLFDDGTHGDLESDDGIYTNIFEDTLKEGTYSFYFTATGTTNNDNLFEREREITRYLKPIFSPDESNIQTSLLEEDSKIQRVKLTITPKDASENYLGPGYSGAINITSLWGKPVSTLVDHLNGTYSQIYELPISVADETEFQITISDKVKVIPWTEGPESIECPKITQQTWILVIIIALLLVIILYQKRRGP